MSLILPPAVSCKLIGIHGRARTGKDTVGKYLHDTHDNTYKLAFADPLKKAAAMMFGIPEDAFWDDDTKEQIDTFWNVSPRQIAQFFGTDMVRENVNKLIPSVGQDFWVYRMAHCLNGLGDQVEYDADDVVVISDVRFQNEYDWITAQGGIIIHLTRQGADGMVGIPSHASEAGISFTAEHLTYTLDNNGTLEELYADVDDIIKRANIYPFSNPDAY
jgi:hypothetical protein